MVPFDEDTLSYSKTKADSAIEKLQARINSGEVTLKFDGAHGYLPAVLKALKISKTSQALVFSKTSFQRERISPQNPRALYFNDDIYIGFIPGAPLMEVSIADPKLGGVFYSLEQKPAAKPRFVRNDQCLECHASAKSMGVPGHLLRSFVTDETGVVDLNSGVSEVTHRTPLADRWGGWYVTGNLGAQTHHGNLAGKEAFDRQVVDPSYRRNVTDLSRFFDVTRYPTRHSDVAALMVLQHQTHMHNFITRLHYETALNVQRYGHVNYLKSIVQSFLKYCLFTEEAPLTSPVLGTTEFAKEFQSLGPKDHQGRSLRQFDLRTRLFKHPCSYLIYSDAFENLPAPMKTLVYQRLWEILTGKDTNDDFKSLKPETRQVILEILRDTKRGLPDYWKKKA